MLEVLKLSAKWEWLHTGLLMCRLVIHYLHSQPENIWNIHYILMVLHSKWAILHVWGSQSGGGRESNPGPLAHKAKPLTAVLKEWLRLHNTTCTAATLWKQEVLIYKVTHVFLTMIFQLVLSDIFLMSMCLFVTWNLNITHLPHFTNSSTHQTAFLWRWAWFSECIDSSADRHFPPHTGSTFLPITPCRMHDKDAIGRQSINLAVCIPLGGFFLVQKKRQNEKLDNTADLI